MPVHNADIARVLDEIADLLEIQGANAFRVRAYRNAARTIGDLRIDLAQTFAAGEPLPKLPGIGEDLEHKLHNIAATGTTELLEQLHRELPPAISELLRVPALGPKRVRTLYDALGVKTLEDLRDAAQAQRIRAIKGFGPKTEEAVLAAVEARLTKKRRFRLSIAAQYAEPLAAHLRGAQGVREVVVAGSYRRMKETVGDLDLLATADDAAAVMERFTTYSELADVTASGPTRASARHVCGLQVDLRVVPVESFGAALHYFTGSKAHNIAIRRLGQEQGLKINEYGVFTAVPGKRERRIGGETEASVFAAVDLPWIPPELRENAGEIEAARQGRLPHLVELGDLRGDLHARSNGTDGYTSLADMARAARERGLEYLAITDHSRRQAMAHGLDPQRLAKQIDAIDRQNARHEGAVLLKGVEVDILEDGSLDLPDSVLGELDLVVAAVHTSLNLPRARQTERILKALESPCVTILAHPLARLLEEREGYDVDMLRIVRKARDRRIALELNAHPERLDLSDIHCRMAKEEGVLVAISSDAHYPSDLEHLRWGVGQARRGWLEARDVLNTKPLDALHEWLRKRNFPGRARAEH